MAAAEQIKALIKSFGNADEARFYATAMQIAASAARKGQNKFAQDLKKLIDQAKQERSRPTIDSSRVVQMAPNPSELSGLIESFSPRIKLVDMVLSDTVRKALERVVSEQRRADKLRSHGLQPSRKLLLQGPPGTGKTMTAEALAGELGLDVFVIRLDGLISKYMGEALAKLQLLFEAMRQHRAVYLFDEFDSIGYQRSAPGDVGEMRRLLNTFLINLEKDDSHSLVLAATNLPQQLDPALSRRFDAIITYPLPEAAQIEQLMRRYLRGYALQGQQSLASIAKEARGLSQAEVSLACKEVLKDAVLDDHEYVSLPALQGYLKKRKS